MYMCVCVVRLGRVVPAVVVVMVVVEVTMMLKYTVYRHGTKK
jgi:hypothetical protein